MEVLDQHLVYMVASEVVIITTNVHVVVIVFHEPTRNTMRILVRIAVPIVVGMVVVFVTTNVVDEMVFPSSISTVRIVTIHGAAGERRVTYFPERDLRIMGCDNAVEEVKLLEVRLRITVHINEANVAEEPKTLVTSIANFDVAVRVVRV